MVQFYLGGGLAPPKPHPPVRQCKGYCMHPFPLTEDRVTDFIIIQINCTKTTLYVQPGLVSEKKLLIKINSQYSQTPHVVCTKDAVCILCP